MTVDELWLKGRPNRWERFVVQHAFAITVAITLFSSALLRACAGIELPLVFLVACVAFPIVFAVCEGNYRFRKRQLLRRLKYLCGQSQITDYVLAGQKLSATAKSAFWIIYWMGGSNPWNPIYRFGELHIGAGDAEGGTVALAEGPPLERALFSGSDIQAAVRKAQTRLDIERCRQLRRLLTDIDPDDFRDRGDVATDASPNRIAVLAPGNAFHVIGTALLWNHDIAQQNTMERLLHEVVALMAGLEASDAQ